MHKGPVVLLIAAGMVAFASAAAWAQPAPEPAAPAANHAKKKHAKKTEKKAETDDDNGADAGAPASDAGAAPSETTGAGANEGTDAGAPKSATGSASAAGTTGATAPQPGAPQPALPPTRTSPTRVPSANANPLGPMAWPEPGSDAAALRAQGAARPEANAPAGITKNRVYAEDWWSHLRPVLELHGYFRLRAELFHNFSLGRIYNPAQSIQLWPQPTDNYYNGIAAGNATQINQGSWGPQLCTAKQSPYGTSGNNDPAQATWPCANKTQAGANIRFRIEPELHISDNLRVMSEIDMLDNLVLGSTPDGYAIQPGAGGGYQVVARSGYTPLGAFDDTEEPPTAGVNGVKNSIAVKRVWAEYMTPVGELRFGRMPNQWGLGILANAGDGYDDDYQSTSDRIMFITGIKSLDLYFAGAWDFVNEGPTSTDLGSGITQYEGQPYDLAQLDDVNQYVFVVVHKTNEQLQKLQLAKGGLVVNGGMYVVYRSQLLTNDVPGGCSADAAVPGCAADTLGLGYTRRGAQAWIPDLWLQVLYKKFRFEMEAVTIQGSLESVDPAAGRASDYVNPDGDNGYKVREYGLATQIEQKLVEDKLRLQFDFGYASGDAYDSTLTPPTTPPTGVRTISTFRFNPNYKIDLILNRNILTRVQGEYYFRPSADYAFLRNVNGQKLGGGVAVIWTRASQFVQAPGHDPNLGIELDGTLYFQSKDGSLNDDPDKMGGFYTMLQYGVLFPLAGLGYPSQTQQSLNNEFGSVGTSAAQILRWYMGVLF
jgi:uncharacterized protein (TIGR04551 family)